MKQQVMGAKQSVCLPSAFSFPYSMATVFQSLPASATKKILSGLPKQGITGQQHDAVIYVDCMKLHDLELHDLEMLSCALQAIKSINEASYVNGQTNSGEVLMSGYSCPHSCAPWSRLQQELGLPADLLTRGKRTRKLSLRLGEDRRQHHAPLNAAAGGLDGSSAAAAAAGLARPQSAPAFGYGTAELMGADRASSMAVELETAASISRPLGAAEGGVSLIPPMVTPAAVAGGLDSPSSSRGGPGGVEERRDGREGQECTAGHSGYNEHSPGHIGRHESGIGRSIPTAAAGHLPAGASRGGEEVDSSTRLALLAAWQASLQAQLQMHLRASQQPVMSAVEGLVPPTPYNSSVSSPGCCAAGASHELVRACPGMPAVVEPEEASPASCRLMRQVSDGRRVTAAAARAGTLVPGSRASGDGGASAVAGGDHVAASSSGIDSSVLCNCLAQEPSHGQLLQSQGQVQWQEPQQQQEQQQQEQQQSKNWFVQLSACSSSCPSGSSRGQHPPPQQQQQQQPESALLASSGTQQQQQQPESALLASSGTQQQHQQPESALLASSGCTPREVEVEQLSRRVITLGLEQNC